MIFVGNRSAKQGHKAVAEELVDGAFIPVHRLQRQGEEAVQQGVHVVWTQAFGHSGRVGQIAEAHRHLFTLTFQSAAGVENFFGQML